VAHGEVWRLVTGHWTHWTADHLLWDVLTFLLLATLCETLVSRRALLAAVAGSALLISAGFWVALPELVRYRGLSGIDSALFVLLAVALLRREGGGAAAGLPGLALLAFLARTVWEVSTGGALFADGAGSFVPVPLAHLLGGAWGVVVGTRTSTDEDSLRAGCPCSSVCVRVRPGGRGPAPLRPSVATLAQGSPLSPRSDLNQARSGNIPAAEGSGAAPSGRPRSGRSSSPWRSCPCLWP
jgi:rhomboid family GlyGly-CTERM serine protease